VALRVMMTSAAKAANCPEPERAFEHDFTVTDPDPTTKMPFNRILIIASPVLVDKILPPLNGPPQRRTADDLRVMQVQRQQGSDLVSTKTTRTDDSRIVATTTLLMCHARATSSRARTWCSTTSTRGSHSSSSMSWS
jgi:hypothetical protein